jgi:hypothetical protein
MEVKMKKVISINIMLLIIFSVFGCAINNVEKTETIIVQTNKLGITPTVGEPTSTAITNTKTPTPTITIQFTNTVMPTIGVTWPDNTEKGNEIIQHVISILEDAGVKIEDLVIYTDENDPNSLLGRPNQYIAKASWRDSNIAEQGEASVDNGGSIEVFSNFEDLKKRYDYIDAISSSASLFAEYHYQNPPVILRLSKTYLPSEAKKISDAFLSLTFNK